MVDLIFCAHYPFSDEAKSYAKEVGLSLDRSVIDGAVQRLTQALGKDGEISTPIIGLEAELKKQISYYAASRMILASFNNRYAIRRMAVAESKRARKYLKTQKDRSSGYVDILARSFGLEFKAIDGEKKTFLLPFQQYLLNTPSDVHYKLANMELEKGHVKITSDQRSRILEEAIRKRLEDESALPRIKNPPKEIKEAISKIAKLLPKENLVPTKIDKKDFPPCITKMLDDLQASVNIAHSGRLSLAIYLIRAGLSDEQINSLFSSAPDYNKETTIYQIKYIRDKAYSMPSCSTMDTYGLCIAQCRCSSPIHYRQTKHGFNAKATMVETEKKQTTEGEDA
jgi:DNA primase large subunit